ncbi:MAG: CPBP family intramembrane metalloprotease [Oscillospiraceae bacterium]|nr:CPBP family intramembrane metalloprotease [Oscillospiraceae bacterium]
MQELNSERVIDVVEDFACPQQTECYHEAFRKWRRREKNRYAFRCKKHPKEAAFSESKAVSKETPAQIEQGVLGRLGYLIGCLMILYLVVENVLDKVIVLVLNLMGLHVSISFWDSGFFGDELGVFLSVMLVNCLKYLLPALLFQLILRFPLRVGVPMRIAKAEPLLFGAVLTMLLSAGLGMFFVSSSQELEKYKLICNAADMADNRMVLYMLFTIFALPIMMELLLHGALFQALRQFGDAFASLAVTLVAACLMHNPLDSLRSAIITLTISYFVLRSGSFLTAIVLHIVHEIYMFALFYIETFGSVYSLQWWLTILLPCVVGLITGVYILWHRKPSEEADPYNHTFLRLPDKITAFFSSFPMLSVIIVSIVLAVISVYIS